MGWVLGLRCLVDMVSGLWCVRGSFFIKAYKNKPGNKYGDVMSSGELW